MVKNLPEIYLASIPGTGRSPGEGNGNPLQYSCLENPTDRGAWQVTAHRVTKSWTWLKWQSMHASSFPSTICWEDCILSTEWSWEYARVHFGALYSIPLAHISVFRPVSHCFDYSSFVIKFEIRKNQFSNFCCSFLGFFFFFWLLRSLDIRMGVSISGRNIIGL